MLNEQLRLHENFGSRHLEEPRNILVYLPKDYGADPDRRYPVLYMHDGQNLYDPADAFGGIAWGIDETAERLVAERAIEPVIIVGIYNTGKRLDEYTPVPSANKKIKGGGRADLYGRMLIEELKPFIDDTYLTLPEREFTGIGGSSLGGLVSLYLGFRRPDVFSRIAAMSPSVWWANNQIIREIARTPERVPLRIWLDIGREEGSRIKHQVRALRELLLASGWTPEADFRYGEIPGAAHNEAAWAARFDQVLKFLFPLLPGVHA
jgi:predicted alpha/beta superfamily hydrolase